MRLLTFVLVLPACATAYAADWPQRQGNPQRTGYTADSPKPPYKLAWKHYFPEDEEKVHPQVQPVIYQGKVFVGTKQGSLYCFDAASGKVLWKLKEAKGPILHTAACAQGRVVFSCLDGFVRALDVADGKLLWAFDGGRHGFNTAPCLADGKVFLGSRAGVFYCLDQGMGKPVWKRDMGAFIFNTAAWNEGRVFFGTEDMVLHCLDAKTGNDIWKSPRLYGASLLYYYPVVSGGKVVVRTMSMDKEPYVPVSRKLIEEAAANGKFAKVPEETKQAVLSDFKKNPHHQNFFVFDEKTGAAPYVVCHNHGGTNEGFAAPPCMDAQGLWPVALSAGGREPSGWTWMVFARGDPQNGRFVDFVWHPKTKACNPDEQEDFSVGGNILFVAEQEEGEAGLWCAFDLDKAEPIAIPQSMPWDRGLQYNAQMCGGHAMAISGRRFYHIAFHCLGCWEGAGGK